MPAFHADPVAASAERDGRRGLVPEPVRERLDLHEAQRIGVLEARGRRVDRKTDLYSLGVILYEAATRRAPFRGGSGVALLYHHVHSEPEPPRTSDSSISPDLEAVCLKALEKEPEHRYPDAGAFARDLENALASRPITASSASTARNSTSWAAVLQEPGAICSSSQGS